MRTPNVAHKMMAKWPTSGTATPRPHQLQHKPTLQRQRKTLLQRRRETQPRNDLDRLAQPKPFALQTESQPLE
jgi:hypothetical protein